MGTTYTTRSCITNVIRQTRNMPWVAEPEHGRDPWDNIGRDRRFRRCQTLAIRAPTKSVVHDLGALRVSDEHYLRRGTPGRKGNHLVRDGHDPRGDALCVLVIANGRVVDGFGGRDEVCIRRGEDGGGGKEGGD